MRPLETPPQRAVRVVIVSGLSGSGKSTAAHALEDIGFFCIDNLPAVLMPKVAELFPGSPDEIEQVALVVDAREGRFLPEFQQNVDRLRASGSRVEVLFLESTDAVLLRRYNETRRRHPLAPEDSVEQGIAREKAMLLALRQTADWVIDTSGMNPHQLRELIQQHFVRGPGADGMNVTLVSFGFKYGLPPHLDLLFDVRFLPNPYFVPALRDKPGTDPAVRDYVLASGEAATFLQHVEGYLRTFRPLYDREGKSYLSVGIGCTGGRHRSVAIAEELRARLAGGGPVQVRHRDLERP